MDWLEEMTAALAEVAGVDPAELQLGAGVREEILDLARIASHHSGERINAPLLCYALGIAVARGHSPLTDLGRAIRSRTDA
jgi:hypothetical protein